MLRSDNGGTSMSCSWGLGIITFGMDGPTISHEAYVSFLGVADRSTLLWTPLTSGLERYQALRLDIETLCQDYTTADGSLLMADAGDFAVRMEEGGVEINAEAAGDQEKRRLAREAFRGENYTDVVELLGSVAYP